MKKFIVLLAVTLGLVIAQPVYASDAPAGNAPAAQAQAAAQNGSDLGTWILLALLALGAIGIIMYTIKRKRSNPKQDKQFEEQSIKCSSELARISSTLLAALIALMTFLLIVGVQNSVSGFTTELYAAIILLGLGLVLYALGNVVRISAIKGGTKAVKSLIILRGLQQLIFVGSIVAVVWFAFSYAQLVIKPLKDQQSKAQSQPQPPQPTGQQPSATEQPPAQPQPQPTKP